MTQTTKINLKICQIYYIYYVLVGFRSMTFHGSDQAAIYLKRHYSETIIPAIL